MNTLPLIAGTMHDYMKNTQLQKKVEERKKNPNMKSEEEIKQTQKEQEKERMRAQISEQAEGIRESNKITGLDMKLSAGGELTNQELEYLKQKSPDLYEKAMEIKRERQQYKKDLQKCRTKEDVDKLNTQKLQSFAAEVKSIKNNPNITEAKKRELVAQIGRRMMGILSEQAKFMASKEYKELPTEEELEEGKKKKKIQGTDKWQENDTLETIKMQLMVELEEAGISFEPEAAEASGTENTINVKA